MGNISHSYFYFMIFFFAALFVSLAALKSAFYLNRRLFEYRKSEIQKENYAGGFPSLSNVYQHFPVRFSLIALLFVLYNAELLLLLPWAMSLHLSGAEGFLCAVFFLFLWAVAYVYEYRKGALEWK